MACQNALKKQKKSWVNGKLDRTELTKLRGFY